MHVEGTFLSMANFQCVLVYTCEETCLHPSPLLPPQSVDDLPVLSDKGRVAGEQGTKNAVKLQSN